MKTAGVPANATSPSSAGPSQPSQLINAAPTVQFDVIKFLRQRVQRVFDP